jgi:hypothetical protein
MYGLLRDVGYLVERVNRSDEPVEGFMLDGKLPHLRNEAVS